MIKALSAAGAALAVAAWRFTRIGSGQELHERYDCRDAGEPRPCSRARSQRRRAGRRPRGRPGWSCSWHLTQGDAAGGQGRGRQEVQQLARRTRRCLDVDDDAISLDRNREPRPRRQDAICRRACGVDAVPTGGDTGSLLGSVDDPHLGYDKLEAVAGAADPGADLRIGVCHAPYLRVLDQYVTDGYDLVFAALASA